jgi:predicted short-subunit dehydrogenase-like oxidoreductase (DUF2520 family)
VSPSESPQFAVIGPGRVGAALARCLVGAGWALCGVAARSEASARRAVEWIGAGRACRDAAEAAGSAPLVLLTVPDRAIEPVARSVAHDLREGSVVLHASGALSSDVLACARPAAAVGALHPLQSFASPEQALEILPGSCLCFEGDEAAGRVAEQIAAVLGGPLVRIRPEAKALYHAAACVACNYLVALEAAAVAMLERAGIPRDKALPMLLPLVRGTVANLEQLGLPHALTGPIARGDWETVQSHREALASQLPELLDLYGVMEKETAKLARALAETPREEDAAD